MSKAAETAQRQFDIFYTLEGDLQEISPNRLLTNGPFHVGGLRPDHKEFRQPFEVEYQPDQPCLLPYPCQAVPWEPS